MSSSGSASIRYRDSLRCSAARNVERPEPDNGRAGASFRYSPFAGGPFKPAFGLSGAADESTEPRRQEVRNFSTASPKIFPLIVTNNLDRAYRKSKMELCAQHLIHNTAQGRRRNLTLRRLSPCPGIFCQQLLPFQYFAGERARSPQPNCNRINIFHASKEKNCRPIPRASPSEAPAPLSHRSLIKLTVLWSPYVPDQSASPGDV